MTCRIRAVVAIAGALGLAACGGVAFPHQPVTSARQGIYGAKATLEGPITAGHIIEPLTALPLSLGENGYVQQEFFASGTAWAFRATSSPRDGRWTIEPTTSAPYRTRILVRRPVNPKRFNGMVVVEWMNVTEGEAAPDWDYLSPELMRDGYAYVGVSAQAVAVEGGTPILGSRVAATNAGLVGSEPERYATLHHPGDQYSFDIFAQIGQALRDAGSAPVLGGLHPHHIIATGESQSAFYLTTFADTVQPRTHAFDGLFLHSRGGAGAPLNGFSIASTPLGQGLQVRTDLDVPVFMFETQTDVVELDYASARQPNTARVRTWEVAGTSHVDQYLIGSATTALGCGTALNDGPQHVVIQAALAAFNRWVADGTPPPSPPPFRLSSTQPVVLALDGHGNVIGGVRTPAVDVPVSTLSGSAPAGESLTCSFFGSTAPFSQDQLIALYHDQGHYLQEFRHSLDMAIADGFILPTDRGGLLAQAQQVTFPS